MGGDEAGEPPAALVEERGHLRGGISRSPRTGEGFYRQRLAAIEGVAVNAVGQFVILDPARGIESPGGFKDAPAIGGECTGNQQQHVVLHPGQAPEETTRILERLEKREEAARGGDL